MATYMLVLANSFFLQLVDHYEVYKIKATESFLCCFFSNNAS